MSDLLGYLSSFLVTFGMGFGFLVGGLIFAFLLVYAVMLLFGKTRRSIQEDKPRSYGVNRNHLDRLIPVKQSHRRTNPAGGHRK